MPEEKRSASDDDALGELSARSRARLLESVVLTAHDAVIITEAQTDDSSAPRIVFVNPAFTRMTGYTSDEAIGKTPRILQGRDTSALARSLIRDALTAWQPITIPLLNYRKDGSEFWVEVSITPVADDTGWYTHWVSVQRDITERRVVEENKTRARIAAEKHIALSTEILQREQIEARLAYSVAHDDLTGLHNRSYFIERLDAAVKKSRTDRRYRYSIIHLDLDRFKNVNDRLGYHIGDRILRQLARRLRLSAGEHNTLARIGDDEFGLLLDGTGEPAAVCAVAELLLAEVSSRPRTETDDVTIGASIGIVHSSADYDDAESVMRDADTALVRARRLTGNAFVVFTPEMRNEADVELRLRNDLHGAVERGEMRLFYQPLVDIVTSRIYGFEALIRWEHPERGRVSPLEFIPIAEATGLIVEIGRWVLYEGCRMLCELQRLSEFPLLMSVNVSSQQLLHGQFMAEVEGALQTTGVAPATLQLEITESVFLAGPSVVGSLLARLRTLGVKIALDDFGTGYSSLSYLENYQIDTLKIDQSFVARIDGAAARSEIVRMIIALAHALGVDVVAEGVETRGQRDVLGNLGCTHLQGYLYSRPLPSTDVVDILTKGGVLAERLKLLLAEIEPVLLSPEQREELREQVQAALDVHSRWMTRLHAAVRSGEATLAADECGGEDRCQIAIWLNTAIAPTLRRLPLYAVTKARHAAFHRNMARFLSAVLAKDSSAACSLRTDGYMATAAASLVQALHDWSTIAATTGPIDRATTVGIFGSERVSRPPAAYAALFG